MCIVEIFGDFALEKYTHTWKLIDLGNGKTNKFYL
jgi:hypothetical protein